MKKALLLGVIVGGIILLLVPSMVAISFLLPNIGLPFGYYGKFNRVKYRLKHVDGIRILGYHQHKDLSLEDFWFTVQTQKGLAFDLQFSHVAKTHEFFNQADGLAVKNPDSGRWLLYAFGSGERLEVAVGKEIRNAVDVLQRFDKIAEVVEADRRKGVPDARLEDVPKSYLWIIFPSFYDGHRLLIPI
jgi:hypothetical protein